MFSSSKKWAAIGQSPVQAAPAMQTKENMHKLSSAIGRRNLSKDYSPVRSMPTEMSFY